MEPSEQPCSEGLSTPNPRLGGLAITTTTSLFSYPPSTAFTMVDRPGTLAQPLQLDTFSLTSPTTQGGNGPIPEIAQPLPGSFPRWKQYSLETLLPEDLDDILYPTTHGRITTPSSGSPPTRRLNLNRQKKRQSWS